MKPTSIEKIKNLNVKSVTEKSNTMTDKKPLECTPLPVKSVKEVGN